MTVNRRKFIKNISLGLGVLSSTGADALPALSNDQKPPLTNMCGYAAPKINTVRVGVVGLGMRGSEQVRRLCHIDGLEIVAICDKYADRVAGVQKKLAEANRPKAAEYSGTEGWKALCDRNDIDLVYVITPWALHAPIAIYAMNRGKHAATEVPAAQSIEQCWQLVETSEKTRKHCMMLENCCYDFFEMLTLNMTRNGLFGELIHGEGAYIHALTDTYSIFKKDVYADLWRLHENIGRNGNLYPTHGLGPVAQCMNINRGDYFDYLVSISSNDFTLNNLAKETAAKEPDMAQYINKPYRGNMNTSIARTFKGKTIMIQHDISTTVPYSRIHQIKGTKGMAQKYPAPDRIAFGHQYVSEDQLKGLYEKYTPPIINHVGEMAKKVGGHGGMDFIMDWRLIDCLRNGLPLDQDVYDAAAWSAYGLLSEKSVAKNGRPMDFPDFTKGRWKTNKPVDLTLNGGATTKFR